MCGIFGIVREHPAQFDYSTFCTLGIANDSRGGDSCGVFIDGSVEYGVKDEKLFQDFFTKSVVLQNTHYSTIALGHCRKASVGAINMSTAQPVVIQNENNETEFVVLHNGTIHNYQDLAEKYIPDVDIKGMTDSQVMARIFYYKGYDVLEEYTGGAVFFIVDYRENKPKIMFFKGASKKYVSDLGLTEERPLYFCITDDEMVFSSIPSYLLALRPDAILYTPAENVLGEFKNGKPVAIKKYDRSNCLQQKLGDYYNTTPIAKYIDYLMYNANGCFHTVSCKRISGEYFVSNWGGLYEGKPGHLATEKLYLFNGIPFLDKKYYDFVCKYFRKSNKDIDEFTKDNEYLIRYLSVYRLYVKDGILYLLKEPDILEPYTGDLSPIGSTRTRKYKNGTFVCEIYESYHQPTNNSITEVNLKALKNLWKL